MKEFIYKMRTEAKEHLEKYFEYLSKYLSRQEDLESVGIVTQNSERGGTQVDALMNLVKNRTINQERIKSRATPRNLGPHPRNQKNIDYGIKKAALKNLGFQAIVQTKTSLTKLDVGNLMVKKLNNKFQMSEYFYYLIHFILMCGQIEQYFGFRYKVIKYYTKALRISNKLSISHNPNLIRVRAKVYLCISQFLFKDKFYSLSQDFAYKSLDLCSLEFSNRINLGEDLGPLDFKQRNRMRKCASVFYLSCVNIAYNNIFMGDPTKAYEAFRLGDFVIKKMYRPQDQMFRASDKLKRFIDVKLLPFIWRVREFYKIIFELFSHSGMLFYQARREGMKLNHYQPVSTKNLIKFLKSAYQNSHIAIYEYRKKAMQELLNEGSGSFEELPYQPAFHMGMKKRQPRAVEVFESARLSHSTNKKSILKKSMSTGIIKRTNRRDIATLPAVNFGDDPSGQFALDGSSSMVQRLPTEEEYEKLKMERLNLTKTKDATVHFMDNLDDESSAFNTGRLLMMSSRPMTAKKKMGRKKKDRIKSSRTNMYKPVEPEFGSLGYFSKPVSFRIRKTPRRLMRLGLDPPIKRKAKEIKQKKSLMIGSKPKDKPKLVSETYFKPIDEILKSESEKKKELREKFAGDYMKLKFSKKSETEKEKELKIYKMGHNKDFNVKGLMIPSQEMAKKRQEIAEKKRLEEDSKDIVKKPKEISMSQSKIPRTTKFAIKEVKTEPLEFSYNPQLEGPPIMTLETYFKKKINLNLDMAKIDEDFERAKGDFIHRTYKEDFDKKEFRFCKQMMKIKGKEKIYHGEPREVLIPDLILDHRFMKTINDHENFEKGVVEKGLNTLATYILKYGLREINKNRKPKLVDIMLKHPEVFKMDCIYAHRKKLEKDREYAKDEERIQEYFLKRAREVDFFIRRQKSKQMIYDKMRELHDEIEKDKEKEKLLRKYQDAIVVEERQNPGLMKADGISKTTSGLYIKAKYSKKMSFIELVRILIERNRLE